MGGDFGFKLGIEGEKQFKQALRDINQNFKVLKSEMNLTTSAFDKNDRSVEALTARNKVLAKGMDEQKGKVSVLEDALRNAASSFGENDKRTQAWAMQLNNAKAELNGMEREVRENEKAIDAVGDEFQQSGKQADGFEKEIRKGADTAESSEGRFSKLGQTVRGIGKGLAAGVTAMAASVAAIGAGAAKVSKELYGLAKGAAETADTIDKNSQKFGMSRKAYQEWDYVLSQNGVSMESMNTAMKSMTASMSSLAEGGKKGTETLGKLGISVDDLKTKSQEDIFKSAIVSLQKMPEGYEKARLAQVLFGKQGQEMLPMLNQSKGSVDELMQKAHDLNLVMGDESVDAGVKFTDSLDSLNRSFSAAKNMIGAQMLPGLVLLTDGLSGLIAGNEGASESIREGAKSVVESLSKVIPMILELVLTLVSAVAEVAPDILTALIDGLLDNLPELIKTAGSMVSSLLAGITSALPQVAKGALDLASALITGILENLPALLEAAVQVVITLAQGIAESLPVLIPKIIEAVVLMVTTLLDNIDLLIDAALQLIMGLAQGLILALPELIEKIPVIIDSLINAIVDSLPLILEMGIQLIVELALGLIKAIPSLLEAVPKIIWSLIKGIGALFSNLSEAGGNMLKSIWNGFKNLFSWYWGVLSDFWGSVFRKIREFVSMDKLKEIGKNMITGLWNGIKDMTGWILDKIRGFGDSVMNGLKKIFGISSPSLRFRDEIGKNLALGLGEGFVSSMASVSKDMQRAIPAKFDTDIALTQRSTKTSGTPASGFVVHIDTFVNNRAQDVAAFAQELEFYISNQTIQRRGAL